LAAGVNIKASSTSSLRGSFSLTFYDCLFDDGLNISHAKRRTRHPQLPLGRHPPGRANRRERLPVDDVFGGLISSIGGDFDFSGGLAPRLVDERHRP
jgi:hypothetical protein